MHNIIPKRYRSAFKYEALRAGSMSMAKKREYYKRLYHSLKRQAVAFEKSEFAELEFQQSLISELKPIREIEPDEIDAKLSRMADLYYNDSLSLIELRDRREEFYSDYEKELHQIFYKNEERTEWNNETYIKYANFVEEAHSKHISSFYDSVRWEAYRDERGQDWIDSVDEDELYYDFFEWMETMEGEARTQTHWNE